MAEAATVVTDGIEMEYFKFGKGDKSFVVLPGLTIQSIIPSKDDVEAGFDLFKDDFTIYVFDRRKNISHTYSIYDMGDDTATVMKKLGLKDTYIFGASQGGMIAQVIAVRYPQLVKKMILGSTSPCVKPSQRAVIDKWIKLAKEGKREELYLEYGKEIYPPEVYEQFKEFFLNSAASVTDEDLKRFTVIAESILHFDITDELGKINCPVLAIGDFEDPVLDSDATMEIAVNLDHRPDFKLFMYTGYGHAVFDTAPDYRKRVYDFFME